MADAKVDVLLIGGGPAAVGCAEALREGGFEGSVLLAMRELDPPYDRPPCSKGYLQGRQTREELHLHPVEWYAERGIDMRTRTGVMKLDTSQRVAKLASKEEIAFDKALVATGAQVRRLRVDGAALEGSHYLRAPGNADGIRKDLESAERVVLIGGSYIACEVAASLTTLGKRCTMLMLEDAPMTLGFGEQVGAHIRSLLESHGVELICCDGLERFEGSERVETVVCTSGRELPADVVVLGTGAQPDVMLARSAGLELGESGGVACSKTLQTSVPGIWAAGDMCEYDSVVHGRRLRVEHWEVAAAQGRFAAGQMIGGDAAAAAYEEIPYFWSDLADWATLEYVGPAASWDEEVVRGSFDDGAATVFYLSGGKVAGALTIGRPEDLDEARELMRSGAPWRA